jgi:hypothetical protein
VWRRSVCERSLRHGRWMTLSTFLIRPALRSRTLAPLNLRCIFTANKIYLNPGKSVILYDLPKSGIYFPHYAPTTHFCEGAHAPRAVTS